MSPPARPHIAIERTAFGDAGANGTSGTVRPAGDRLLARPATAPSRERAGSEVRVGGISIGKQRPADVVAPGLISEHEVSNLTRQLLTLPLALDPAGSSVARISMLGGLYRIGGSAEIVLGNMSDTGGLPRGVCRETRGSPEGSRRRHGVPAERPGLHHLHPTVGPRSGSLDCLARARVCRHFFLEEMQHVLRAGGGPEGQQLMMGVGEFPPRRIVTRRWSRTLGRITRAACQSPTRHVSSAGPPTDPRSRTATDRASASKGPVVDSHPAA